MIKRLFILLAVMMLWKQSAGQANLGIPAFYWNGPQTVSYGDSTSYWFVVKNYGPGTVNSPINIYTGVWDSSMASIDTISIDSTTLAQTTLGPGDSALVSHTQVFDSANFRIGATVVVIWPAAVNANTQNSASYTVYIQGTMSLLEVAQPGKANIYPNPASDRLTISPPEGETGIQVEQVRLYDATGRFLQSRQGAGTLDIGGLAGGAYLLEVVLTNNTKAVYRVIKQE